MKRNVINPKSLSISFKECSNVSTTMIVYLICQILCHYVSYSYSKMLKYNKKRYFVKMSLIRLGSIVPTCIQGYFSLKSRLFLWGIDSEDLSWHKILQKKHSCWWMVKLFKLHGTITIKITIECNVTLLIICIYQYHYE